MPRFAFRSRSARAVTALVVLVAMVSAVLILPQADPASAAAPNLTIDKKVDNAAPQPGELFKFNIRYRCTSLTDNCTGAQITDDIGSLVPNADLVFFTGPAGLVTSAAETGGVITWDLVDPLPAGSAGTVVVSMRYPACVAASGGLAGSTDTNTSSFTATNGAISPVTSSVDVTMPTLPECPPAPPTPPASAPTELIKGSGYANHITVNGRGAYGLEFPEWDDASTPAVGDSYVITDDIPDEMVILFVREIGSSGEITMVEIECADSGVWHDLGVASSESWFGSGDNVGTECVEVVQPNNTPAQNITGIRWTVNGATGTVNPFYGFDFMISDTDPFAAVTTESGNPPLPNFTAAVPGAATSNCLVASDTSVGTAGGTACAENIIPAAAGPVPVLRQKVLIGDPQNNFATVMATNANSNGPLWNDSFDQWIDITEDPTATPPRVQGPADLVWGHINVLPHGSGGDWVDPVFVDLLDANVDYIPPSAGGTNWWHVIPDASEAWGMQSPTIEDNPACWNPTFTATPDWNGTGRTMLRWEFPGCTFFGGARGDQNMYVYFSATIKPGTSAGTSIENVQAAAVPDYEGTPVNIDECSNYGDASDWNSQVYGLDHTTLFDDSSDVDSDGDLTESVCIGTRSSAATYVVPVMTDMTSSKWVQGLLDTDFSRYPTSGDTDLTGVGTYELFIENSGNVDVTAFDVVDILPWVGDTAVLPINGARLSEWAEQLVGPITVDRWDSATSTWVAVPAADFATGPAYSTSVDPCRFDADPAVAIDALSVDESTASFPTGCDANPWTGATTSAAAGASSFGFRFEPSTTFAPGEQLRITVDVELDGPPPGCSASPCLAGETVNNAAVAWNSFAFGGEFTADGGETTELLLDTEPIKVGLKMIDTDNYTSIGNYVWIDADHDGEQDPTEAPVAGVTVRLYEDDGSGAILDQNADGILDVSDAIDTTTTDANGLYRFDGLDPNAPFIIRLDNPADFVGAGPLGGYSLTLTDETGIADNADNDALANATDGLPEIFASTGAVTGVDDPADPSEYPTNDFGFWLPASVGDFVWYDLDGFGDQGGEPPVEGVTVTLYNATSGAVVGTTTTDATGYYLFDELPAGDYELDFDWSTITGNDPLTGTAVVPTDWVPTANNATGNPATDSDPDSTGITPTFTLAEGQHDPTWDMGLTPAPNDPVSIGNYVWEDLNLDGIQDAAEAPVEGLEIVLLDSAGIPIGTTFSDASGFYQFDNLLRGETYEITVVLPTGMTLTTQLNTAADDATDSDIDPATSSSGPIVLDPDGTTDQTTTEDFTWDIGIIPTLSIGSHVWEDLDNSGTLDAGETGISGIVVNLLDNTGTFVSATITDADGEYMFNNLDAGDYFVEVAVPTSTDVTWAGPVASSTGAGESGTPNDSIDEDDNGVDLTSNAGFVRSGVVTLEFGGAPLSEAHHAADFGGTADATNDANADYSVDFGFTPATFDLALVKELAAGQSYSAGAGDSSVSWSVSVKNQGTIDATGVVITDYVPTGLFLDDTATNTANAALTNVTNNTDGTFTLAALAAGVTETFTIVMTSDDPGTAGVIETLGDLGVTSLTNGAEISTDNAPAGTNDIDSTPDATDADASYSDPANADNPVNGHNDIDHADPLWDDVSEDEDDHDYEVVAILPAEKVAVGNIVWFDDNNNGLIDGVEAGISGVTVELYDGVGTLVTSTTTAGDGSYWFDQLDEGDYQIVIPATMFATGAPLVGWESSTNQDTTDAGDDDANENGDDTETDGTSSAVFTLTADDEPTAESGAGTYAGTLDDNNVNATIDFGFYEPIVVPDPLYAIGNQVWIDTNNNGQIDTGETPVDGVTVTLLDSAGVVAGTDTTAGGGFYLFDELAAGDYTVQIDATNFAAGGALEDHISSTPTSTTDDETDNDDDGTPATGTVDSPVITLGEADGEPAAETPGSTTVVPDENGDVTIDFGFFEPASVGGNTFDDGPVSSADDIQAGDLPLTAVSVTIYDAATGLPVATDASGQPYVATQTTDVLGNYLFTDLPPGSYYMVFTTPTGYTPTGQNTGIDDTIDSDIDPATGSTISTPVTVTSGQTDLTTDAGYTTPDPTADPLYAIGNQVWIDTNNNGQIDTGETPVDGVAVTLLDSAGVVAGTDTTAGGGFYLFDELAAGDYTVQIDATNFAAGGALEDHISSTPTSTTDDETDNDDDGTPATGTVDSPVITLGEADGEPAAETPASTTVVPDENGDVTIDFGFFEPAAVGGNTWNDGTVSSADDIQAGEPAISAVSVTIYDAATGLPVATDASGQLYTATQTTDASGNYLFTDLPPGDYYMVFTTPTGYTPTGQNTGIDDTIDSDIDPATGSTISTPVTVTSGETDLTTDAGYTTPDPTADPLYAIGNQVWIDTNNNGQIDTGETPLDGVTVTLLDSAGGVVATDTTAGGGFYLFDELAAGDYTVQIGATNFAPLGELEGFVSSTPTATTDDQVDNNDDGAPAVAGIESPVITLGGTEPTAEDPASTTIVPDENGDVTIDFGFFEPASVGGNTFDDGLVSAADDIQAGDPALPAVSVTIYDVATGLPVALDASGQLYTATQTTDASGNYLFTDLAPGDYYMVFTTPTGYTPTGQNTGADDTIDSDIDPATGSTISTPVTVTSGETDLTTDAGYTTPDPTADPLYAIGNQVWIDTNNNGQIDTGETPLDGVTVTLLDSAGGVVATDTTAGGGFYLFDELAAGDYTVQIDATNFGGGGPLEGHVSSTPTSTTDDQTDNDDDGAPIAGGAIESAIITLGGTEPAGETPASTTIVPDENGDVTIDFGFFEPAAIGNFTWDDGNVSGADGDQSGEPALAGVGVTIFDASTGAPVATDAYGLGYTASQVTDATGAYLFDTLAPGSYYVVFTAPTGYSLTVQDAVIDGDDSDADPATGQTAPVTVGSGDVNDTVDAGFTTPDPIVLVGDLAIAKTPALQTIAPYTAMAAFTMTITNPGDAPVDNLVVTDSICDSAPIQTGGDANADDRLDIDESWTYTCSVTQPAAGWDATWTNTATVAGTSAGTDLADEDTAQVVVSNLAVAKNVRVLGHTGQFTPAITVLSGTDVEWQVLVTNAGTATLEQVTLTDSHCAALNGLVTGMNATFISGDNTGDGLVTMDPGESWEFTCDTTGLTTATTNEVSVSGEPVDGVDPVAGSANASATPVQPHIAVQVEVLDPVLGWIDADSATGTLGTNDGTLATTTAGSDLEFRVTVLNNGSDVTISGIETTVTLPDGSTAVLNTGTLAPGDSVVFTSADQAALQLVGVASGGTVTAVTSASESTLNGVSYGPVDGSDGIQDDDDSDAAGFTVTTPPGGDNTVMVGDLIFDDQNANGIQDAGEPGIAGVMVELTDAYGVVIAATTTASDGSYSFTSLTPATYGIIVTPPAGWAFSPQNVGGNDAADSDVNPATGEMTPQSATTDNTTWDAGLYQSGEIAGTAFDDIDGDGEQDPGEQDLGGITVNILGPEGQVMGTTVTAADGTYVIPDLPAGTYTVEFDLPAGVTGPADPGPIQVLAGTVTNPNSNITPPATADYVDLVVTKTLASALESGTNSVWTITVTNAGNADVDATVSMSDLLPPALAYTSALGDGWICNAVGNAVACDRSGLAAGETSIITVTALLQAEDGATITNTAVISSTATETSLTNNTAIASGLVVNKVVTDGQLPFTGATTTLALIFGLTLLAMGGAWLTSSRRKETLGV